MRDHNYTTQPIEKTGVATSPQRSPRDPDARDAQHSALAIELTGPLGDRLAIPLSGETPLPLGRSEDSVGDEVTRHDPHLARAHAVLLPVAKGWFLVPEPSMNGVYVRIDGTHQLRPGDAFIMGGTHGRMVEMADETDKPQSESITDPAQAKSPAGAKTTASTDSPNPLVLEVSGVEA